MSFHFNHTCLPLPCNPLLNWPKLALTTRPPLEKSVRLSFSTMARALMFGDMRGSGTRVCFRGILEWEGE